MEMPMEEDPNAKRSLEENDSDIQDNFDWFILLEVVVRKWYGN